MTGHPDTTAFLRSIVASPDDDGLRLIFADWLDEHHKPAWAEVIRSGCNRGARFMAHNMSRLIRRGRMASRECIAEWRRRSVGFPPRGFAAMVRSMLPPPPAGPYETSFLCAVTFVRGFPSRLICPWSWWAEHAAALLTACPIAFSRDGIVRLTTWPNTLYRVLDHRGATAGFRFQDSKKVHKEPEMAGCLAAEWPGVDFRLPNNTAPTPAYVHLTER